MCWIHRWKYLDKWRVTRICRKCGKCEEYWDNMNGGYFSVTLSKLLRRKKEVELDIKEVEESKSKALEYIDNLSESKENI